MNIREGTIALGLLGAGFLGGAYYGSGVFADLERVSLRERLEERRKERDEARKERDDLKRKYDELWEQHRRRPFRESIDPKNTVKHIDRIEQLDHTSWEANEP